MSKIYPTTLFASKIEATLDVKLQMMVTFLWWMKASFPSCSKIPLDEVSAPSVPSLLYPPAPPPKKRCTSSARIFLWKGTNYLSTMHILRKRNKKQLKFLPESAENLRRDQGWSCCRRHFKRNTSCCSCMEMVPAWMLHRKYKNMLPVKLLSIVNSR